MSKRMTSETIIFDTDWLTEADFGSKENVVVIIDYQAYDTLKIIVDVEDIIFSPYGGFFQEFEVYKLKNPGLQYRNILEETNGNLELSMTAHEGYVDLVLSLNKIYWETDIKGIGSIYIKGVKR